MLPTYKRSWILGEDKYVELEVRRQQQPGPVVIPHAGWALVKHATGVTEQAGVCDIEGGRISMLIEPQRVGLYTLEITYEVPPETRKVRVMLDVR